MQKTLLRLSSPYLFAAFGMSLVVNLLYLASPIYMTQIYERVLGSQSQSTLLALTCLMIGAFVFLGIMERLRSWLMQRLSNQLNFKISPYLLERRLRLEKSSDLTQAEARRGQTARHENIAGTTADLDNLRQFIVSPGLTSFFDLPFSLLFLLVLAAMHPWLGYYTLSCVALLIGVSVLSYVMNKRANQYLSDSKIKTYATLNQVDQAKDVASAMGMGARLGRYLSHQRFDLALNEAQANSKHQSFSALLRALRLAAQSGVLGLSAWLVLQNELAPALIFASMILMGRTLAPIDVLSNLWATAMSALAAWARLGRLAPPSADTFQTRLEARSFDLDISQKAQLVLKDVGYSLPKISNSSVPMGSKTGFDGALELAGKPSYLLHPMSLILPSDSLVAIVGPSGSGKTSLLKLILGLMPPTEGQITYNGLPLASVSDDQRSHIYGYQPQTPALIPGTIAQNISGFGDSNAPSLIEAATKADILEFVQRLPQDFNTPVQEVEWMSGGERLRLSLARALFAKPKVLVFDEPTASLAPPARVSMAQRLVQWAQNGQTVIVATHDQAVIDRASYLIVLRDGQCIAAGDRQSVMTKLNKAQKPVAPAAPSAPVSANTQIDTAVSTTTADQAASQEEPVSQQAKSLKTDLALKGQQAGASPHGLFTSGYTTIATQAVQDYRQTQDQAPDPRRPTKPKQDT